MRVYARVKKLKQADSHRPALLPRSSLIGEKFMYIYKKKV